jgi:hypothetical protein
MHAEIILNVYNILNVKYVSDHEIILFPVNLYIFDFIQIIFVIKLRKHHFRWKLLT